MSGEREKKHFYWALCGSGGGCGTIRGKRDPRRDEEYTLLGKEAATVERSMNRVFNCTPSDNAHASLCNAQCGKAAYDDQTHTIVLSRFTSNQECISKRTFFFSQYRPFNISSCHRIQTELKGEEVDDRGWRSAILDSASFSSLCAACTLITV